MFHLTGGLYFQKLPDGQVRIKKRKTIERDSHVIFEVITDAAGWAAVVAAMAEPEPEPKSIEQEHNQASEAQ